MFELAQNLEITLLLDIYGGLLTEKQRDVLSLYYDEDLSLSEIADNEGITRQGVHDSIKRAEVQLVEIEEKLGFLRIFRDIAKQADAIESVVDGIDKYNSYHGMSKELFSKTKEIRELLNLFRELN